MNTPEAAVDGTPLAASLCDELGLDFGEAMERQFVIAERLPELPAGWSRTALGPWQVAHCPKLARTAIGPEAGPAVALILGVAVTPGGEVLSGRLARSFAGWREAEAFFEDLAGRFLVLAQFGGETRLYVDPSCGLVPFYDPGTRRIASCVPLALSRPLEDNPWLPLAQYRSAPNQFYLFGETADARVRRMLGNHYLDLGDFSQHRHYPKPDFQFDEGRNNADRLEEMIALLSVQMGALIRGFRCALPITGGGDSRILLATAAEHLGEVAEFYCHVNHYASMLDSIVATSVAEAADVPLRIVNVTAPVHESRLSAERCAALREMIALRTSFQMRPEDKVIRVHEQAPDAELTLRGGLVEMTRSNKWPKRPAEITPKNGVIALARPLKMPEAYIEAATPAYAEWLDGLPPGARPRAYDFGHAELWMPTMGNTVYNGFSRPNMLNPFNSRRILHLTAELPPFFRKSSRPQRYILRRCMPDLRRIPYANRSLGEALNEAQETRDLVKAMGRKL